MILSFIQQTSIEYLLYQTIDAPGAGFFLRHLLWLTVVAQAEFIELITNEVQPVSFYVLCPSFILFY